MAAFGADHADHNLESADETITLSCKWLYGILAHSWRIACLGNLIYHWAVVRRKHTGFQIIGSILNKLIKKPDHCGVLLNIKLSRSIVASINKNDYFQADVKRRRPPPIPLLES